jgi:hypothetical protein
MIREKLDPRLKEQFEELVKEVSRERDAYGDSSKAQMWVALTLLAKKISDLEMKVKKLSEKKKPINKKLKKSLNKL